MSYHSYLDISFKDVLFAIVTVSDKYDENTDPVGEYLKKALPTNSLLIMSHSVIKKNSNAILNEFYKLMNTYDINVILFAGGTGVCKDDVTIETIVPLLDKELHGFNSAFNILAFQEIGTEITMSRAIAGIKDEKVIICLPGPVEAVKLAFEKIIEPQIRHLVLEAASQS